MRCQVARRLQQGMCALRTVLEWMEYMDIGVLGRAVSAGGTDIQSGFSWEPGLGLFDLSHRETGQLLQSLGLVCCEKVRERASERACRAADIHTCIDVIHVLALRCC